MGIYPPSLERLIRQLSMLPGIGQKSATRVALHILRSDKELAENEEAIAAEMLAAQGEPMNIGGYFQPDAAKCTAAMRPSATFNAVIDAL